jgi:hypothetical protein
MVASWGTADGQLPEPALDLFWNLTHSNPRPKLGEGFTEQIIWGVNSVTRHEGATPDVDRGGRAQAASSCFGDTRRSPSIRAPTYSLRRGYKVMWNQKRVIEESVTSH